MSEEITKTDVTATVIKGGPFRIIGSVLITETDGSQTHKPKAVSICRCGASQNKPYCDGAHKGIGWDE